MGLLTMKRFRAAKEEKKKKKRLMAEQQDEASLMQHLMRLRRRRSKHPDPPAKRPNIQERISMLQMAVSLQSGHVPADGCKLSIVIPNPLDESNELWMDLQDFDDGLSIVPTTCIISKAVRAFCSFLGKPWRQRRHGDDAPVASIRVRLLVDSDDEHEW
ncbi:hypothetical protein MPSEU_000580600 [Mayamaea pseudoterrestris]|nr:hypothetical protein MPSEU_000580600 [Mayamaea pseudoterrestris]